MRGPAFADQERSAIDHVLPGVEFFQALAGQMPVLAAFAAAAHMRHREHAAKIEKRQPAGQKHRVQRDAIGAVGLQQQRRLAVALQPAAIDDRQRNSGPIPRRGENFLRSVRRKIQGRRRRDVGLSHRAVRRHVAGDGRAHPALQQEPGAVMKRIGVEGSWSMEPAKGSWIFITVPSGARRRSPPRPASRSRM